METLQNIIWKETYESLNNKGYALLPSFLDHEECEFLKGLYDQSDLYRSVINMERYRFGKGEYKYFNYPLPERIASLRAQLYLPLAELANTWMAQLGVKIFFPEDHQTFVAYCHSKGQVRPTPLILKYGPGGFNTLHQDLYGEVYFPFQVIFSLTQSGVDYDGGQLVITEQIPRAQTKAEVITPNLGDAVIITTNFRPKQGTRGHYRANVKHGVSEVKWGTRYTLGIVFHDAA